MFERSTRTDALWEAAINKASRISASRRDDVVVKPGNGSRQGMSTLSWCDNDLLHSSEPTVPVPYNSEYSCTPDQSSPNDLVACFEQARAILLSEFKDVTDINNTADRRKFKSVKLKGCPPTEQIKCSGGLHHKVS